MEQTTRLGKRPAPDARRDAVHVAILPAIAGMKLFPGAEVRQLADGRWIRTIGEPSTGIVDPFLKLSVQEDEPFWLLLHPGSITSLTHDWDHPDIPRTNK